MELTWDRPAHIANPIGAVVARAEEHTLRIRVSTRVDSMAKGGLPLRMAIAVDCSGSMEGEKLSRAKDACAAVVRRLRPEDKLWLAVFSTRLTSLLSAVSGGTDAAVAVDRSIASLHAEGATRTDLALDWLKTYVGAEVGVVRLGVLITDGHATDGRGTRLDDLKPLVEQAGQLGRDGLVLCSAGLGNANDFNTEFLLNLCTPTRGAFLYADTPDKLEYLLGQRLTAAQAVAAAESRLIIESSTSDIRLTGMCRIRPDYVTLDSPLGTPAMVSIGSIRSDLPTDLLLSVVVPPLAFADPLGYRDLLRVTIESAGAANVSKSAGIKYTNSFVEVQQCNSEVDRDRLTWDINVHSEELVRTKDDRRTGELLQKIASTATKVGQSDLAKKAAEALDNLKKTGRLPADRRTGLLAASRNTGGV